MRNLTVCATVALLVAFASLAGSAAAETTVVKKVKVKGTTEKPEILISGEGFGKHPPTPTSPVCFEGTTGLDYEESFYVVDWTEEWEAGAGDASALHHDCIGLVVVKWSAKKIIATLGSWYEHTDGEPPVFRARLNTGDKLEASVYGATATINVKYPKPKK